MSKVQLEKLTNFDKGNISKLNRDLQLVEDWIAKHKDVTGSGGTIINNYTNDTQIVSDNVWYYSWEASANGELPLSPPAGGYLKGMSGTGDEEIYFDTQVTASGTQDSNSATLSLNNEGFTLQSGIYLEFEYDLYYWENIEWADYESIPILVTQVEDATGADNNNVIRSVVALSPTNGLAYYIAKSMPSTDIVPATVTGRHKITFTQKMVANIVTTDIYLDFLRVVHNTYTVTGYTTGYDGMIQAGISVSKQWTEPENHIAKIKFYSYKVNDSFNRPANSKLLTFNSITRRFEYANLDFLYKNIPEISWLNASGDYLYLRELYSLGANISGNLVITGNESITGNLTISGSETVTGNESIIGNLDLNGSGDISGKLIVSGEVTFITATTGMVSGLNADMLDGMHSTDLKFPYIIVSGECDSSVATGEAVYSDISNIFQKAVATASGSITDGIVSGKIDSTHCWVVLRGDLNIFSGLTAGTVYYLSNTTAGELSTAPPDVFTDIGSVHQVIGRAISATTIRIDISEGVII